MATHSSILAWRIPWTEEPGGLQSMGLQRFGHNWVTNNTFFLLLRSYRFPTCLSHSYWDPCFLVHWENQETSSFLRQHSTYAICSFFLLTSLLHETCAQSKPVFLISFCISAASVVSPFYILNTVLWAIDFLIFLFYEFCQLFVTTVNLLI